MAEPDSESARAEIGETTGDGRVPTMTLVRAGLIATGLAVASGAFVLGITLPILQLTRFFVWTDTFSVLTMILALFTDGEWLLGCVVLVFSVLMPGVKIIVLGWIMMCSANRIVPPWMHTLVSAVSKWSMLDVLLIALVIFAVKTSGIGTATSLPGLYYFTASIILGVAISFGVTREAKV